MTGILHTTSSDLRLNAVAPSNPTLSALTIRLDEKDRRRKPRTALGSEPRIPTAIIAEVEEAMAGLAGKMNGELKAAVRAVLGDTPTGIVDAALLQAVIKRVRRLVPGISAKFAQQLTLRTLQRVERFNSRDIRRAIGIAVPEYSQRLGERWRSEHVDLIKSFGSRPKDRMVGLLRDASQKQTRVETLRKQVEEQYGVNYRRARLIARDQILTLNAKLTEDRHKRAGITHYKWRTVDGSARSNHKDLDGKIFAYDDPPLGGGTGPDDYGNPGTGIGCRCQAIPIIPAIEEKQRARK